MGIKFETDMDRHAWREYAAAALAGLASRDFNGRVDEAAEMADAMLEQERKRRK